MSSVDSRAYSDDILCAIRNLIDGEALGPAPMTLADLNAISSNSTSTRIDGRDPLGGHAAAHAAVVHLQMIRDFLALFSDSRGSRPRASHPTGSSPTALPFLASSTAAATFPSSSIASATVARTSSGFMPTAVP